MMDIEKLIQQHNDSLLLLESELLKLKVVNQDLNERFSSFIIGNHSYNENQPIIKGEIKSESGSRNQSVFNIKDSIERNGFDSTIHSAFDDVVSESKVLNHFDDVDEESHKSFNLHSTHNSKTNNIYDNVRKSDLLTDFKDDQFNSHEFSSDSEADFASVERHENDNNVLNESLIKETLSLKIKDEESLIKETQKLRIKEIDKERIQKEESFLDSSSPNQNVNEEVRQGSPLNPVDLVDDRNENSNTSFIKDPVTINKANLNISSLHDVESKSLDSRTKESLKQLVIKSSELINDKLEITSNFSNKDSFNDYGNSKVLSEKLYNYNAEINFKSNKLINDLNKVIDSFS